MENSDGSSPGRGSVASARLRTLRHRVWQVIELGHGEDRSSRIFDAFLVVLIIANILAFCAETVADINDRWGAWLTAFEIASVGAFTVEYLARLWVAVEMPFLKRLPPWRARLRYARRPLMVIDLLAILPHYLGVIVGLDLRVLRALRLLRLLKLSRYSPAMHTLIRVIGRESRALVGAGFLLLVVLLISATGMYFIEGREQPDKLGNVPLAAYWAMTTLTTVGYGDVVPITPLGKVIAALTAVMGVAMLALPVGIVATSFADVIHRRAFVVTWSMVAKVPLFTNLGASELAEIIQLLHSRWVPRNEAVARRGEKAEAMYFIVSGEVEVELMDADNVRLGRGDFFGEIAILTGEVRNATVRATRDAQLLVLQAHDLERLMDRVPEIGKRIREIGHKRAPDRVEAEAEAELRRRRERKPGRSEAEGPPDAQS
jgi:voltage-gated potassium channel